MADNSLPSEEIKLIAFDLDGVLVDGRGSWRELHDGLNTSKLSEKNVDSFLAGDIDFKEWARLDTNLWLGRKKREFVDILSSLPLMKGAMETMHVLKEGRRLVIISGGLQILADRLKEDLGMDAAVANRLLFKDDILTGIDPVVDFDGKGKLLREYADRYGIKCEECAAVGDYENDISMFKVAGFSIAFNPSHESIVEHSDVVVREKDLRKILPYLQ